jgi:hypothetical protein
MERVVFGCAKPGIVIITTPNAEYNVKFPRYEEGQMRHADHRFEWTRNEFVAWAKGVAEKYNYKVTFKSIGEEDPIVGSLSQMGVFYRQKGFMN